MSDYGTKEQSPLRPGVKTIQFGDIMGCSTWLTTQVLSYTIYIPSIYLTICTYSLTMYLLYLIYLPFQNISFCSPPGGVRSNIRHRPKTAQDVQLSLVRGLSGEYTVSIDYLDPSPVDTRVLYKLPFPYVHHRYLATVS